MAQITIALPKNFDISAFYTDLRKYGVSSVTHVFSPSTEPPKALVEEPEIDEPEVVEPEIVENAKTDVNAPTESVLVESTQVQEEQNEFPPFYYNPNDPFPPFYDPRTDPYVNGHFNGNDSETEEELFFPDEWPPLTLCNPPLQEDEGGVIPMDMSE
jgi:hypothetical protein